MRPVGGGWRDGGGGGGGGGGVGGVGGEERRGEPGRNVMQESSVWKTCVCVCVCVCVSACPVFLYLLELTRIWFTRRIQLLQPRSGKGQRRIMWRYRSSAVITALIKIRGPSPTRRSEAGQAALRLGGPHGAWSRQNGRIKPRQQHAKCRCWVFTRRRGTSAGNWLSVI